MTLFKKRLTKLWFILFHPRCWRPCLMGVAPSLEHWKFLTRLEFDQVIDVGANRGQFSLLIRTLPRDVPIFAVEPLPEAAETFERVFGADACIDLHVGAVGAVEEKHIMHLAHDADSSSLYPVAGEQVRIFPGSREVSTREVTVTTLDQYRERWPNSNRMLMKIDVQGAELDVLKGATETLQRCAFVTVECSHTELYIGQPLYVEIADHLEGRGFTVAKRYNEKWHNGTLVQADYLFQKTPPAGETTA
jgi:FkbM family methyltransferase